MPVPVRERQADRARSSGTQMKGEAQEGRDPDHQADRQLVAAGQDRVTGAGARPRRRRRDRRPAGQGTGRGGAASIGVDLTCASG